MAKPNKKKNSKAVNNPHDKLFKATFGMKSVVKGYFLDVFPKQFSEKLDLETLERESTSYITKDLEETYSDLVWRCQLKSGLPILLSFLFEHKSYKPKRPHLQIGEYQFSAYRIQDQTNPNEPLIQVIPIIVYHGQENWELKEPFESYFGRVEKDFENFLPRFDFILTNIKSYSDEAIRSFNERFLEKIFLAFKHYLDENYIKSHYAELAILRYNDYENEETTFFIHAFDIYLSNIVDISFAEIEKQIEEYKYNNLLNSGEMVAKESFLQKFEKKIHQEGRQEGRQEGQEKMIMDIYQKTGWSAKQISGITSFTEGYIQSVIDKFEKKKMDN